MNKVTNKTKKFFTQIPNDLIRNSNISDRARFLYCYMSSMSEDWQFYQSKMAKDLGYSKDTLRKYLDELVSTGYLKRTQKRSELGRFDSYDYVIDFIPNPDLTVSEKTRHGEFPSRKNPSLKKNKFKEEQIIKNINLQEDNFFENPSEFSKFETITIDEKQSSKVNPFSVVANLQSQKEKEKTSGKKEKESSPKPERKPNPTYEAFTVFCQTFEQLSGAAYPTDQKGNYIMSPKDAGGMVYLLRWIEKVDRNNDNITALKVFLQAAWDLNDKWIKANFNPATLYGQAGKIYTAYQTSSPAAKKKAYDDEVDRLLAEKMKKYQTQ
jgi:hypothetical protein